LQSSSTSSRLERVGMQALSSDEGLFVLGSILRSTYSGASVGMSLPLLAALPISWGRFLKLMPSVPAFFSEVEKDALEADGGRAVAGQTGFAAQLAKLSEKERTSQIETYLTGVVGDVLGREVGGDEPLMDAGLDSLGAVELHNTVQQSMGVELPTTIVFDYPNINAVSSYISGEIKDVEVDDVEAEAEEVLFIPSDVDSSVRLYCLAYAGGVSEQIFAEWSLYLPASIQVCPIELPGHGRRFHETAFSDVKDIAENLAANLPFDKPCAFFALSTGAIVMYETIQRLIDLGEHAKVDNIIALFPAACPAPHLFPFFVQRMFASKDEGDLREITNLSYDFDSSVAELMEYMDDLPKDTVLDVLEKTSVFSGIDKLRQSDDLYNFIMPGILCDSKVCLNYRPKNGMPLPMPVIALFGDDDVTLGYNDVLSWRHYTSHVYKIFRFEGDHFFVNEAEAKLKTIHLVADHIVGIHDAHTSVQRAQQRLGAPRRALSGAAAAYRSHGDLGESTPIVLLVSPGLREEDVVQMRHFLRWTSRGVYTLSGNQGKPASELGAQYLNEVLTIGCQGPFIVVGWSAGAIVAYDLAVRLEGQQFQVEKLILLDGLHPTQLRDFGECAKLQGTREKREFVMQRVLQRHYMWPRFSRRWPEMPEEERMEEFLQIYSGIVGRDYTKEMLDSTVDYMEQSWDYASLAPHEYTISDKFRSTLLYFRPTIRGGLPLVDDAFNIDFQHVLGWHDHCSELEIVDVPGDHFTMTPASTYQNLPFWRTMFKTYVEWHHNEGGILQERLRAFLPGKNKKGKNKRLLPKISKPAEPARAEADAERTAIERAVLDFCVPASRPDEDRPTVLGCIPLPKAKGKGKRRSNGGEGGSAGSSRASTSSSSTVENELDFEAREALEWLSQRMASGGVSPDDRGTLVDFLETMDSKLVVELVEELRRAGVVLSIETLTDLPKRAQEILAEGLGISQSSIARMASLSNRTRTLRIVIKSFLKTRK